VVTEKGQEETMEISTKGITPCPWFDDQAKPPGSHIYLRRLKDEKDSSP